MSVIATYPSKSRPNLEHEVHVNEGNGEVFCTCEAFHFNPKRPKTCTHIKQAIAEGKLRTRTIRRPVLITVDWAPQRLHYPKRTKKGVVTV